MKKYMTLVALLFVLPMSAHASQYKNSGTGYCLAASGSSIVGRACNNSAARLTHQSNGRIQFASGLCLTAISSTAVRAQACGTAASQKWYGNGGRLYPGSLGSSRFLYMSGTGVGITTTSPTHPTRQWRYACLYFC